MDRLTASLKATHRLKLRAALSVATTLLLAGCGKQVVIEYVPVEVERVRYIAVPAELTNPHAIAEGPLSACPDVAAQRAAELRKCNVDKAEIRSAVPDSHP